MSGTASLCVALPAEPSSAVQHCVAVLVLVVAVVAVLIVVVGGSAVVEVVWCVTSPVRSRSGPPSMDNTQLVVGSRPVPCTTTHRARHAAALRRLERIKRKKICPRRHRTTRRKKKKKKTLDPIRLVEKHLKNFIGQSPEYFDSPDTSLLLEVQRNRHTPN